MAFGQEIRDFLNAYKVGSDIQYQNARRDEYRERAAERRKLNAMMSGEGNNNPPARAPQVEGVSQSYDTTPTPGTEEQRKLAQAGVEHYTKAGESPIVAAGLVGNEWAESSLNPTIGGDLDKASGRKLSYGLYQFHERGRQPVFNKWVADNQRDRADSASQRDFVLFDLKTNFPETYKRMQAAKSPEQSAEIFMREYERPRADVARLGHRQGYAKTAYGLYDAAGGMRNPAAVPARSYNTSQTGPTVYPVSGANPARRPRDRVAALEDEELMYEQTAAKGGMIQAVPAYNDGGFAPTVASAEEAQYGGRNDDLDDVQPASYSGGSDGAAPKSLLGAALDGGLKFLQRAFGLGDRSGVDETGRQTSNVQAFMRGEGAASAEEYEAVMARIDPNGVLTTAQRNIRGLENIYQFYMSRGEQEKADRAAASLIQYSSNMAAKYAALSVQAGRSGNVQKMAEFASKAYDYTPDGSTADGKVTADGKIAITQRDAETNKPIRQFTVTPQELLSSALGMTTKNEYWNRISEAAERHMGTKPTVAAQRQQQRQAAIDEFYNTPDDEGGVKPASQSQPQEERRPAPQPQTTPAAVDAPATTTPTQAPQVATPEGGENPADLPSPNASEMQGFVIPGQPASAVDGTTPGSGAPAAPREAVPAQRQAPQRPTITPYQDLVPRPQMSESRRAALAKVAAVDPSAAKALMAEWEKTVLAPWKEAERRYYEQARQFAADELNNQRTNQRTEFQENQANKRTEFSEKQQTARMLQQEKLQMQRQAEADRQARIREQERIQAEERKRLAERTPAQVEADNMQAALPDKAARALDTGADIGITSDGELATPSGGTVTQAEVKTLDDFKKNPIITQLTKDLAQIRSLREGVRVNNTQGRDDVDKSLDAAIGTAFTVPNPKYDRTKGDMEGNPSSVPAPLTAEQKGAAKAIAYQIMRYNDVTPEDAMKMTASLLFVNPEYDTRSGPATTYDITDQGRVRLKSTGEEIIMPKNAITGVDLYRKAELNGVFKKRTERNAAESKRFSDAMRAADEAETYRRGKAAAAMGPYDNRGAIPVEAPPLFDPTLRGKKLNAPKAKDFQSLWD